MATNDKYDRQLRLWGANGQRALSEASILLIGPSAVGTETLKNLVLPGIGSFVIMDDESYLNHSSNATGNLASNRTANFFLPNDDYSNKLYGENNENGMDVERKSCAEIACDLLAELNDDVKGSHRSVTSLSDLSFDDFQAIIREFTLVIAADLSLSILRKVTKACWENDVHLVSVKSYGLIGTCRIQTISQGHAIIESKPTNSVPDLRIWKPFPELVEHSNSYNMDKLDDKEHGHVPFVVILLKGIKKWKEDHDGKYPISFQEKEKFKNEYIKSMARDFSQQINFEEAFRDAYLAYSPHKLPYEVQYLLDNIDNSSLTAQSRSFDVLLIALKSFMNDNSGELPLNGNIPDMSSATEPYVALQEVYHKKAGSDFSKMKDLVHSLLKSLGRSICSISDDDIITFCKNIFNIQVLRTRSFENELSFSGEDFEEVKTELMMNIMEPYEVPSHTPFLWFLVLRACEMFEEQNGLYPGSDGRDLAMASDIDSIMRYTRKIVNSLDLGTCDLVRSSLTRDHASEMVRYFNAELHNIASIIGGVASQECVKLITKQYVPINNTYVFNGIASTASVYKF